MKLSVLALDYDGTIARGDRLDPAVRDAIADARTRGTLLKDMNAAVGNAKVNALAAVATELARQQTTLHGASVMVHQSATLSEDERAIRQEVPAVVFENVSLAFDDNVILREVSFSVRAGRMMILLGGSGAGKSVTLKLILGLLKPDSGVIRVNGERIDNMTELEMMRVRGDIGMLFQESALFDSLTVADNVGYRLYEETDMAADEVRRRIEEVLGFIGLEEYIDRMPSELSGGQRRRVAIARAIAARPHLLLFDSPTSGLDPITAKTVDHEVIKLRDLEHVSSILVTHQLEDAFYVVSHEAVRENGCPTIVPADQRKAEEAEFLMLKDGRIHFEGNAAELRASKDPYLKRFLSSGSTASMGRVG